MQRKLLRGVSLLMITVILGTSINLSVFAEDISETATFMNDDTEGEYFDDNDLDYEQEDIELQIDDNSDEKKVDEILLDEIEVDSGMNEEVLYADDREVPVLENPVGGTVATKLASIMCDSSKIEWSIDTNGHLSLKGEGDISIGGPTKFPWYQYREYVTSATVELGDFRYGNNFFDGYINLKSIDLSKVDTSRVAYMDRMFYNCVSLKELDLKSFDTSRVEDMSWMFFGCNSLERVNLSSFNTYKLEEMDRMFYNCKSLRSIDADNFDLSNVTNLDYIFANCESAESIDMAGFNTKKVEHALGMFLNCTKLKKLNLSEIGLSNAEDVLIFLNGCSDLELIAVPVALTKSIYLPGTREHTWYRKDGTEVDELPLQLKRPECIKRDYIPLLSDEHEMFGKYELSRSHWVKVSDTELYYYRNGEKLKKCEEVLFYAEDNWDEGWFGTFSFDEDGKVMAGVHYGKYYNDDPTSEIPYGMCIDNLPEDFDVNLPSVALAKYNYVLQFVNDVDSITVLGLSTCNFKSDVKAALKGTVDYIKKGTKNYSSLQEAIALAYMNDSKKCKELLEEIVNQKFDMSSDFNIALSSIEGTNKATKISLKKMNSDLENAFEDKLKEDYNEYLKQYEKGKVDKERFSDDYINILKGNRYVEVAGQLTSTFESVSKEVNDLSMMFKDYSEVISFLESIIQVVPEDTSLYEAATDLLAQYETQYYTIPVNCVIDAINEADGWSELFDKDIMPISIPKLSPDFYDTLVDLVISVADDVWGFKFDTYDIILSFVRDNSKTMSALENITISTYMLSASLSGLRNVEKRMISKGLTSDNIVIYSDIFDLTKLFVIYQYENMADFYDVTGIKSLFGTEERETSYFYCICELDKLYKMSLFSYGALSANVEPSGFEKIGDNLVYKRRGKIIKSQWIKINDKSYFFDKDGFALVGLQNGIELYDGTKVDKTYYFSDGDGSCKADEADYGVMCKGLYVLDDGYYYFFDEYGRMAKNIRMNYQNNCYVFDEYGHGALMHAIDELLETEFEENTQYTLFNWESDVKGIDPNGKVIFEVQGNDIVLEGNDDVKISIDKDCQKVVKAKNDAEFSIEISDFSDVNSNIKKVYEGEEKTFEKCDVNIISVGNTKDDVVVCSYKDIELRTGESVVINQFLFKDIEGQLIDTIQEVKKGDEELVADDYYSGLQVCEVKVFENSCEKQKSMILKDNYIKLTAETDTPHKYFIGWYDKYDECISSDTEVSLQISEDTIIYEKYKYDYMISFDPTLGTLCDIPDGLTVSQNGVTVSKMVTTGEVYGALPKAQRDKYVFAGWFTEREGGIKVSEESIVEINGDTTLYAHWEYISLVVKQKYDLSSFFKDVPNVKKYVVSSIDGGRAKVSKKGILKANKQGIVCVTPYVLDGSVLVPAKDVESIYFTITKPVFSKKLIGSFAGQTISANDVLVGKPTNSNNIIWLIPRSSKVCSIDSNTGVIHILKSGAVKITAKFVNDKGGVMKLSVKLIVKIPKLNVKDVFTLNNGKTKKLTLKNVPQGADVRWKVEDDEIVDISNIGNKCIINAKAIGKTKITAIYEGQEYSTTAIVQ